jgi:hypothetical protein
MLSKEKQIKEILLITEDIQDEIEEQIDNINFGGCAIFALYYYRAFKPLFNELELAVKFTFKIDEDNDDDEGEEIVEHVYVKLSDHLIDGEEIIKFNENKISFLISEERLLELIHEEMWNIMYNTDQDELVEAIINKNVNLFKQHKNDNAGIY